MPAASAILAGEPSPSAAARSPQTRPWAIAAAAMPRTSAAAPPREVPSIRTWTRLRSCPTTSLGNQAVGGSGQESVDYAVGGAINSQLYGYYNPYPTLSTTITGSSFTGNQAIGGTGIPSYETTVGGGALALTDTPTSVTSSSFVANQALAIQATATSPFLYYGPLSTRRWD